MESSRIKTVVIILLLIVNIVMGALLIRDIAGERRTKSETMSNLQTVMENNGIAFNVTKLPEHEGVYTLVAGRSLEKEAELAKSLLSECVLEEQGGNIQYYHSGYGEAYFRGSSEFDIAFTNLQELDNFLKTFRAAFVQHGINVEVSAEASGEIAVLQTMNGLSVFNCSVTVTYHNGLPETVSGRCLLSDTSIRPDQPAMDATTALLRFIAGLNEHGYISTEINEISLGYLMQQQFTGQFELTPVWSIVTDTGEYYVNAITGAVEKV